MDRLRRRASLVVLVALVAGGVAAALALAAPSNDTPPSISGTARIGETLTANDGAWTAGTGTVTTSHQWRRCNTGGEGCADIGTETGPTYVLTAADVGSTIRITVTATDDDGPTTLDSPPTPVVEEPPGNNTPPAFSGTAQQGQTLTRTSDGIWTGTPPPSLAREWLRCDTGGANCVGTGDTDTTHLLTSADTGKTIRLRVVAQNSAGSAFSDSAASAVVAPPPPTPPANTTRPSINDTTPVAGQTLTGADGSWTGTAPITFARRWERCSPGCAAIPGATGATYTVTAADIGKPLRFVVGATNAATGPTPVEAASLETTAVRNNPPVASFTVDPAAPTTGQTITFTSTSTDPDGTALTYEWDLGTGTFVGGEATATASFPKSGSRTIRLKVTDANGGVSPAATVVVAVANRPPVAAITRTPLGPASNQVITFDGTSSTDPDGTVKTYAWDLDNDGAFNDGTTAKVQRSYPTRGTRTIRLRVTDDEGAATVAEIQITIDNQPPVSAIGVSPAKPTTSTEVTFTSAATDPDGPIASLAWDLDDDGQFDDGDGATARGTYRTQGKHTVRLRVIDNEGAQSVAAATIDVANSPPTASFSVSPEPLRPGVKGTFSSTSSDPDGPIVKYAWDLDDDGQFDDGTAATVTRTYRAGSHTVRLRVTDADGATNATARVVIVTSRGAPLLTPFPIVRMAGGYSGTGVRVSVLSVEAPAGSRIEIRCRGRRCPTRRQRRSVGPQGPTGAAKLVRLRRFERGLPAGTVLEFRITKPGMIGKFTRFRIRTGRVPQRLDRCLMPGSTRPARCP